MEGRKTIKMQAPEHLVVQDVAQFISEGGMF
jgi:hypothetical protein